MRRLALDVYEKTFCDSRELLNFDVLEDQRYKKATGKKFGTLLDTLKGLSRKPYVMIHFSKVKGKIGVFPGSTFQTPIGVYSYILTPGSYKDIKDGTKTELSAFALDRPYIHVTKVKSKYFDKVILVNQNGNAHNYKAARFKKDLDTLHDMLNKGSKLISAYPEDDSYEQLNQLGKDARHQTPIGKIWRITQRLTNSITKWSALLRRIGIFGVFDYGAGLIHPSELSQAVLLRGDLVDNVATGWNPMIDSSKAYGLESSNDFYDDMSRQIRALVREAERVGFKALGGRYKDRDDRWSMTLSIESQSGLITGRLNQKTNLSLNNVAGPTSETIVRVQRDLYMQDQENKSDVESGIYALSKSPRKLANLVRKQFDLLMGWMKEATEKSDAYEKLNTYIEEFGGAIKRAKGNELKGIITTHIGFIRGQYAKIPSPIIIELRIAQLSVNVYVDFRTSPDNPNLVKITHRLVDDYHAPRETEDSRFRMYWGLKKLDREDIDLTNSDSKSEFAAASVILIKELKRLTSE